MSWGRRVWIYRFDDWTVVAAEKETEAARPSGRWRRVDAAAAG